MFSQMKLNIQHACKINEFLFFTQVVWDSFYGSVSVILLSVASSWAASLILYYLYTNIGNISLMCGIHMSAIREGFVIWYNLWITLSCPIADLHLGP